MCDKERDAIKSNTYLFCMDTIYFNIFMEVKHWDENKCKKEWWAFWEKGNQGPKRNG